MPGQEILILTCPIHPAALLAVGIQTRNAARAQPIILPFRAIM
jgi:hypothetical protein